MQRMLCPHCGSMKCKPVVPTDPKDFDDFIAGNPPFHRQTPDGEVDDLFLCLNCNEEYWMSEADWTSESFEEALKMIENGEFQKERE